LSAWLIQTSGLTLLRGAEVGFRETDHAFVASVTLIATVSIPLVRRRSKADEKPNWVFWI
jgi:hypothetical protein